MDYQLEIKQIVDYPRCRIYREFLQTLMKDRTIRTNGSSYLFYFMILCSYANFRSSYRRLEGISYLVGPGEWICKTSELSEWFRTRFQHQAISILSYLQDQRLHTESFFVGGQILVRILNVKLNSLEDISVKADVKSVNGNTSKANLGKCKIQGKYAGIVTDIHKGTVFVRLHIGVNAVAHSCYDNRMPGKKDEVSFVVTRIDEERNVAVGLISRIIKQNI